MAMPQLYGRTKSVTKRSKKYLEEALYVRLFKEGSSEVSVRQQLNQFLKSSKRVFKWEVGDTIKKLRSRNLYYPAVKLSETMSSRGMNKTVSDQAIHLDLVAKTRGIPAAENYFIDLPETSKNLRTYGALLNCYCKELMTEEAEALIEKMKELNLGLSSMSYNSLMTLYTKVGQPERIPAIIQEMKADNVMPDSYTYNVWMRALAAVNDISGVERVIEEMKRDGRVAANWTTYSNLASIYVDAGYFDKAEKALKELEKINANKDLFAFQFLITLYGRTGKLLEVYRIWRSLRLAFPKTANISYLNMIQVLVNLKDVPGAEKCFREWESGCSTYDIRVANVIISAYAKEGLVDKAEELKERARRRGAKPNSKKPYTVKYGLNHVVGLIENKKASLVLIANDVDPIELVIFLPALCRKMGVPYAIVKGKARLGTVVHKKTAAVLAFTELRSEDKSEHSKLISAVKDGYLASSENARRQWGGGIMGAKANASMEKKRKALEAAIKV